MDRHYQALVIGGGVVGCNVLWHLTREGWSEVALCERRELTAGATWHSSGHVSAYTGDLTLVGLARYTRSQIDRLRTEVEQDLGLRSSGSLRLATRPAHLEEYRRFADAAMTSAKVSDAQSGWEKGYLSTLPALAGANMIMMTMGGLADNVGYSPEALVIDESMLSGVLRSVRGVEVDDRTLAMESIERAIHGDGHFLGDGLTLEMMQSEFVYPRLADRQSIDAWLENGSPDIRSRAREIAREILARHYPAHIDADDDARIRSRFSIVLPREAMRPAG